MANTCLIVEPLSRRPLKSIYKFCGSRDFDYFRMHGCPALRENGGAYLTEFDGALLVLPSISVPYSGRIQPSSRTPHPNHRKAPGPSPVRLDTNCKHLDGPTSHRDDTRGRARDSFNVAGHRAVMRQQRIVNANSVPSRAAQTIDPDDDRLSRITSQQ
jgi:hypothetical protein